MVSLRASRRVERTLTAGFSPVFCCPDAVEERPSTKRRHGSRTANILAQASAPHVGIARLPILAARWHSARHKGARGHTDKTMTPRCKNTE